MVAAVPIPACPLPMISPARILPVAILALLASCATSGPAPPTGRPPILVQQTPATTALLQAVSAVSDSVAWISGHDGTWVRTVDGGLTWQVGRGPAGDSLQFRDIHAFDDRRAVLMSAGSGVASRIYWTEDAGDTWTLGFLMEDERGFLDCLDFWDEGRGVAYGDAIEGVPDVLTTSDGGRSWARVDAAALPPAGQGEGGFAASGTCVRTGPDGRGWIATGAGGNARVLTTRDHGASWTVGDTPMVRGDVAGSFTIAFRDTQIGLLLGGDLDRMEVATENAFRTMDGGRTWIPAGALRMVGPVYGADVVGGTGRAVAVGPGGADWTGDDGRTWMALSDDAWWAVDLTEGGVGWLAGPDGRVGRVAFGT